MTASPGGKGRKKNIPNKDDNYTFRCGSFFKNLTPLTSMPQILLTHLAPSSQWVWAYSHWILTVWRAISESWGIIRLLEFLISNLWKTRKFRKSSNDSFNTRWHGWWYPEFGYEPNWPIVMCFNWKKLLSNHQASYSQRNPKIRD